MALPDSWIEDDSISDAQKLEHFYSLNPVRTPAPSGDALKYFIQLRMAELNLELDGARKSWLNDDSVPDEEKRQWIVGILNANA